MIIKMLLLSDLCLIDNDKAKAKKGIIESELIYKALYQEAINILNIYQNTKIEYINYKNIIYKFFEYEKCKSWLNISDGKCSNFSDDSLENFIYKDQMFYILRKKSEVDFKIRTVNERKYINFLKTCLISLRYIGKYNYIGFGEVEFKFV